VCYQYKDESRNHDYDMSKATKNTDWENKKSEAFGAVKLSFFP
jgi:hypothetical protein